MDKFDYKLSKLKWALADLEKMYNILNDENEEFYIFNAKKSAFHQVDAKKESTSKIKEMVIIQLEEEIAVKKEEINNYKK
jgi:hypothetical protein